MEKKYILALDQGTTSSRALVFDHEGNIVSIAQKEFMQLFPEPGWVEHSPDEIWQTQLAVAREALNKTGIKADEIDSIGITNQRETTIVWDKMTGKPVYNAIVWQDRRTSAYCDTLKGQGYEQIIREKTGLVIDAYFSATKIKWILENVAGAKEKADEGSLAFGTVDAWLIWNLTGGEIHVTDATNASRTLLFNIHTLDWDNDLMEIFGVPQQMLPQVVSCSQVIAQTKPNLFGASVPIAGVAGDQHAALFGQRCTKKGLVKNTYGTGCFMLMNIGDQPIVSKNNLITTLAWKRNDVVEYALEGSIFIAGAVIQWLRDGLGIISSSSEVEALASQVDSSDGVFLVPAFAGLGAPHWNPHTRGTIVGITRGTTSAHLARAALESIAFQTMDVLKCMEADSGIKILELRVDGGATANQLLMQFQADILNAAVVKSEVAEVTAMGAAFFAGLATGFWENVEELNQLWRGEKTYLPTLVSNQAIVLKGWERAVKAAKAWTEESV